ncbi:MAG TPA: hypothetical protein PLW02_02695 [Verrucomicrobiota bacterium]|nr:hypothetical protein [Verrucomicrobiota bacterium]
MKKIISLVFLVAINAICSDVSFFGVAKIYSYLQTSSTSVAILPTNGYCFASFVVASDGGLVTNATVKPSNTTPLRQLSQTSDDTVWLYMEFFNTQSALDTTYPVGTLLSPINYTMTMYTLNDGVKTSNLKFFFLVSPISTPTTPQVQNYDDAQAIEPTSDFTLQWNDLGGNSLDIVEVLIMDSASNIVFSSPLPFSDGALNGASRSITIPANTLPYGTTLQSHIIIAKLGNPDTGYSGAYGIPAMAKDTSFSITTVPFKPTIKYSKSQSFLTLQWSGEGFKLQKSSDLRDWTDITPIPQNSYQVSIPKVSYKLFFRLINAQ